RIKHLEILIQQLKFIKELLKSALIMIRRTWRWVLHISPKGILKMVGNNIIAIFVKAEKTVINYEHCWKVIALLTKQFCCDQKVVLEMPLILYGTQNILNTWEPMLLWLVQNNSFHYFRGASILTN